MPFSREELDGLMRLIGLTRDSEINCEQCASLVAEFTERQLAGRPLSEALRAVEHHLSLCPECREEYESLQRALKDLDR
jgi:hypothetical protein